MPMEPGGIPFPSMEDMPEIPELGRSASPSPELVMINSAETAESPVESNNTASSSKLTSSDKLSALPPPTTPSHNAPFSRPIRSSAFAMSNIKRGWRHSFDASTSLPSIFAGDHDSPMLNHSVWASPQHLPDARFEPNLQISNHQRQSTPDNGSAGKETPRQRVSFDSDRNSSPAIPSVIQAFSRVARGSDPSASSPPLRPSPFQERHEREQSANHNNQHLSSRSPSQSRSRAASPLRILQQWSSGFHRGHHAASDEPFVPVDPFKHRTRFPFCGLPSHHHQHDIEVGGSASSGAYDCDDILPVNSIRSFFRDSHIFITDILLRELYLNFLLRLPAMYFSRVARIFEDADVSRPDIQRMINASGGGARGGPFEIPPVPGLPDPNVLAHGTSGHGPTLSPGVTSGIGLSAQVGAAPAAALMHMPLPFPDEWTPALVSPALIRFKHSWEAFIDSLLREWKTLNVVSALLASTILTIFQVPNAGDDPVTRTFAFLSLICALMSLSYGCIYIVRFGTMRSMFHASSWAEDAQKTKTLIWWNVWVLLATPAVWLAWSMLLFISAILSFVWRTGSVLDPADPPPLGVRAALGPRILVTFVFALGMIYLALIVRTLKKYGPQQNPARENPQVGPSKVTRGSGGFNKHNKLGNEVGGKKESMGGHDGTMKRRGRERNRSTSARIRRGEEAEGTPRTNLTESTDHVSKRGGLKGEFGSRVHSRDEDHEFDVEMDLKIYGDIDVEKFVK